MCYELLSFFFKFLANFVCIYIYSCRIRDVNMEIAVPLTPNPASPYVAVGIEICKCPKEYGGLSCQVFIYNFMTFDIYFSFFHWTFLS